MRKIVLDLETQKSFDEVGGRSKQHLLKISVCGIYDYSNREYAIYEEKDLPKLASRLQAADQIVGFNIKNFDFAVLQPYLNFDLSHIPYFDILESIEKSIGHRVSLESVAQGTLGSGKSGNGLEAILYYRSGRLDLLKKYCLDDVRVTKNIYDYALKYQKLLYRDYFSIKEVPMPCREPVARSSVLRQEALF